MSTSVAGASASRVSPSPRATRPAEQPRPRPTRPRLSLVPTTSTAAPRAPFVVLVATLLVAGLGGLLFLHTALAEDSFRLHDLQVRSALLDNEEQALEQSLASEAAPKRLSDRAQELGMVRSENPAFIRLSDGRILGKPKAGVAPPPPPAPSPSASASTDASKKGTDKNAAKQTGDKKKSKGAVSPAPGSHD
jgi:hypothetical protein